MGGIGMPRIALRLTPDELSDVMGLRLVLRKEGRLKMDLRLRVILLVSQGTSMEETARMCEVGTTTVKRWVDCYRRRGVWVLIVKGPYEGKKPRLSPKEMEELAEIIEAGPEACGLDTGVWTSPIIADLVKRRFGISYHPSQIRRILHKLAFSIQYPKRRLSKADKAKQAWWIEEELPRIKKKSVRRMEC
jgi:transposase